MEQSLEQHDNDPGEQSGSDRDRYYTGQCVGGPFDNRVVQSRYPKGFVLVDKQAKLAWIYDYREAEDKAVYSQFICREPDGRPLDEEKRFDAGLGHDWDVRSQ